MPWLNRFDNELILSELEGINEIYILEDHTTFGGLGDSIFNVINENVFQQAKKFNKFGIDEIPKCSTPMILQYHNLTAPHYQKEFLRFLK